MIQATVVNVAAVVAYPAAAHAVWPEDNTSSPGQWLCANEGAADAIIAVSFDGVTDHVRLERGQQSQCIWAPTRARSCWARKIAGAGVCVVRLTAWSAT
ncbi:MAG: hypothetical protein WC700_18045 [Gemmatimonadaceae bacterium]|jgi:hypothetical protein